MNKEATPLVVHGPMPAPQRRNGFLHHFRSAMITGLVTLFPLWVTLTVLIFIFNQATTFSQYAAKGLVPPVIHLIVAPPPDAGKKPTVTEGPEYEAWSKAAQATEDYKDAEETITSWTWPLFALLISVGVVYVMGVLGYFVVGRRLLAVFEHFIENLPLVKGIYGTVKQVIGVFRQGTGGPGFQRVVLVEFPRRETWCIAFVTNTITDTSTNRPMVCVFIPMTPNPTSGYFQIFPLADVRDTDWSVDQGIKILLSGGLLAPPTMALTGAGVTGVIDAGSSSTPNVTQ